MEHKITPDLRIKKDTLIEKDNESKSIRKILQGYPENKMRSLKNVTAWGYVVNIEAKKPRNNNYIIVLSANNTNII
ncbi:hypothetical protein [Candidatus Albibeggiatoa sp. nov. BB20]|uniref:hypothetical protein n=1 Tax=Candidatus Albibeggiatoa sp. nov. BB20 TaxID=3162723 RepID=UPI0033653610